MATLNHNLFYKFHTHKNYYPILFFKVFKYCIYHFNLHYMVNATLQHHSSSASEPIDNHSANFSSLLNIQEEGSNGYFAITKSSNVSVLSNFGVKSTSVLIIILSSCADTSSHSLLYFFISPLTSFLSKSMDFLLRIS